MYTQRKELFSLEKSRIQYKAHPVFTVTEDFPRFQLVKLSGLIFFPNSLAVLRVDLTKSKGTQRVGNE